ARAEAVAAAQGEMRIPVEDEVAGPGGEPDLDDIAQVEIEHQRDPLGEEVLVEEVGLELRLGRPLPADDRLEVGDGTDVRLHRLARLVDDDLREIPELALLGGELL